MSFLRGYIVTSLILDLIGNILSLLKLLWIRLIILGLYVYHIFFNQLLFFDLFEQPFTLIFGNYVSYIFLGIWILTEVTNQLRIHKATTYASIRSKYYKWLFALLILSWIITSFLLPKSFIEQQSPDNLNMIQSSWVIVLLFIIVLFIVRYSMWTISIWKSAFSSTRQKIQIE